MTEAQGSGGPAALVGWAPVLLNKALTLSQGNNSSNFCSLEIKANKQL